MKNYKFIIFALFTVCLCGCDLLGSQNPQQSLPVNGGLKTVSDLQKALTGAYHDLQTFQENGVDQESNGQLIYDNEILGDNAVFTGSFPTFNQIGKQQISANNGSIEAMWDGVYEAINDANVILTKLDDLEPDSTKISTVKNIRGQAQFIRALEYYYLVNYFALPSGAKQGDTQPGVPLKLEAVTSSDNFTKPSRATVDSVYIQINNDLQNAANNLSPANGPFRATPNAVYGLLSRIALVRHNYDQAAKYSNNVINDSSYSLLPDVTTYFQKEGSGEAIFSIRNTTQTIVDAVNTSITALHNKSGKDAIQVSATLKNAFGNLLNQRQKTILDAAGASATDTRITKLIIQRDDSTGAIISYEEAGNSGASNSNKYEDDINYADNNPVLRYPEILLNRAEALARMDGINQESINLLNKIRERAFAVEGGNTSLVDYVVADFTSKQDLIDAIILERRVELAFEGQRTTTLQRLKLDVRGLPYDSPKITFPIPQEEIDSNPNIEQNPAYRS